MLEQHESIQNTMDIKQELLQSMEIPVNIDTLTSSISGELTKHRELIKKSTDVIKETMKSFQEQQDKVLSLEKKYKDNIEQTSRDIEIIETFTHFIMKTREKYIDVDIKSLEEKIVETCQEIRDKNRCEELKQTYQKELFIFNEYIQKFIKLINNGNMGTTCSLCLQKTVDTYLDPCGHTGCQDCINKLKQYDTDNYNCHICRKEINSFRPLFFS